MDSSLEFASLSNKVVFVIISSQLEFLLIICILGGIICIKMVSDLKLYRAS